MVALACADVVPPTFAPPVTLAPGTSIASAAHERLPVGMRVHDVARDHAPLHDVLDVHRRRRALDA